MITIVCFCILICMPSFTFALLEYDRGAAAAMDQQWEDAAAHYTSALSADPSNPELLYDCGVASFNTNQLDQAEVCFELAADNTLADSMLKEQSYFNLGNVKVAKEQFGEAVGAYEKVLRINPNNERAKHNRDLAKQKEEEKKEQEQQSSNDGSDSENNSSEDQNDSDQSEQNSQEQNDQSNNEHSNNQDESSSDENNNESEDSDKNESSQDTQDSSSSKDAQEDDLDNKQQDNPQDSSNKDPQEKPSQDESKKDKEKNNDQDQDMNGQDTKDNTEDFSDKDKNKEGGSADSGSEQEGDQEEDVFGNTLEGVAPWIADMLEQQEAHESELSKQKMKSAINAGQAGSNGKNSW